LLIVKSYFKAFLTASKENLFWPLVFLPHIVCLIFFLRSDFSAWDMQGHLIAATKFKDSIFPFLSGWNSSHFAGYPQGYLYPSFFHWLIGGLGKITNIEFAFSFWVGVSVLLTPFSWFYFARNHGLDANKIKMAILFQTLLYFAPKNSMGGDVFGTYLIGLVNQQWAMPFFYFYLGSIVKLHEGKNWVLSALFLGIICLSHAFVLFASIIATFAYLFASRDFLNFSRLKVWLKTIFLSLIIDSKSVGGNPRPIFVLVRVATNHYPS
jgi:uncharacterized membrane protein